MLQTTYLTTSQVAQRLACSPSQVRAWVRTGQLPAVRVGDRGHWRIPASALDGLTDGRRVPAPYAPRPRSPTQDPAFREMLARLRKDVGLDP